MKKPLSFKSMLKPKENVMSALARVKSPESAETLDRKKIRVFINQFKCPLCKCLLEGAPDTKEFHINCAWNSQHFFIHINAVDANNIFITRDQLVYTDDQNRKKYVIYRDYNAGQIENRISILDIDGDGYSKGTFRSIIIPGNNLFDYSKLDEKKIRDLIKSILIFS